MFLTDFLPELEREFVTPGTLRIEIVLVPLKKYSDSYDRALQLLCAIKQEKGRSMLEALANLSREDATPVTLQKRLGLDATLWRTCLQDPVTRTMVEAETALGTSLHVSLLPTFFLNGERHIGLPELADLLGLIRPLQEP
jgi:protein-disulfide isomerase